jgi:hypothetical protein
MSLRDGGRLLLERLVDVDDELVSSVSLLVVELAASLDLLIVGTVGELVLRVRASLMPSDSLRY